jgi:hypothetical protein
MPVVYRGSTGHFGDAKNVVRQKAYYLINQEKVKSLKFGITCNPEQRLRLYRSQGLRYNYMYVLYKTKSREYMGMMEDYLIMTYPDYCDNSIHGGGGNYGSPPYYTYCITHIPKKYL